MCSVNGCDGRVAGIGFCNKHYLRFKKYGDPLGGKRNHAPVEERFWRYVQKTESCWEWVGNKGRFGYGRIQEFGVSGKTVQAHRLSYQMHVGPIPDGLFVMHKCDNPSCVNPGHLQLGTPRDNTQDMIAKGRKRVVAPVGEGNGKSKLTAELAKYIKSSLSTNAELARELNLSPNCIRGVRTGRTWKHV
jgi:hypothetical protein